LVWEIFRGSWEIPISQFRRKIKIPPNYIHTHEELGIWFVVVAMKILLSSLQFQFNYAGSEFPNLGAGWLEGKD